MINHARSSAKSQGSRLSACSTPAFAKKVIDEIPEELRAALDPVVDLVGKVTEAIKNMDKHIEQLCDEEHPETKILRQIKGIGPVTSLTYILVIEDPTRFKSSRSVGPYLGLTSRQNQSGDSSPELRITKEGDRALRTLLVGSAHYILGPFGPDCDLKRWGLALASRGKKNAKKRAVVGVARKLAVLLHSLWTTGEVYDPLRQEKARKRQRGTAALAS
jgi:transposase